MKKFKKYIGIDFVEKGRNIEKDGGLDCWGLCKIVWQNEFDLYVPSYSEEYNDLSEKDKISSCIDYSIDKEWVEVDNPQIGDGVVFEICNVKFHIGVIIDARYDRFLHIVRNGNSCVEKYTSPMWNKRLEGFYRHGEMI